MEAVAEDGRAALVDAYATLPAFAASVLLISAAIAAILITLIVRRSRSKHIASDPYGPISWLLSLVVVSDVFVLANHLLLRGRAVLPWDADAQFFPYYVLVADAVHAGKLALWDVWSNAGIPILGDPQVGALSPLTLGIGLLFGGKSSGFIAYWLAIWLLGGLGIFLLGRSFRCSPWGICVVALGYLFSAIYTGNAEHPSWIISYSFLPLTIWRLDVAVRQQKIMAAAEAGALWGLSALSGYPGMTILTASFMMLWTAGRMLLSESGYGRVLPRVSTFRAGALLLLAALTIGLVILSPAYFSFFYEGAGTHTRVGFVSRSEAVLASLAPGSLSTAVAPYLSAAEFYGSFWRFTDASMCSIYCGVCVLILALFAVVSRPRDLRRWSLLATALFAVACALGRDLPLRLWIYDWFYPMRYIRYAGIFRPYYLFSMSFLALLGTRDLSNRGWNNTVASKRFFSLSFIGALLALAALFAALKLGWTAQLPKALVALAAVHVLVVWGGLCAAAFVLWRYRGRLRSYWPPMLLIFISCADALTTDTLSMPTMVRLRYVDRWRELDAHHSARLNLTSSGLMRNDSSCYPDPPCRNLKNDQLITKIPVLNSYTTEANRFHLAEVSDPALRRMAEGTQRVWFSGTVGEAALTDANFGAFLNRTHELGTAPILIHTAAQMMALRSSQAADSHPLSVNREQPAHIQEDVRTARSSFPPLDNLAPTPDEAMIARLPAAQRITFKVERYTPQELSMRILSPANGWLMITDRWARTWHSEVNGKRVPVYGANFIFRAIPVQAGHNEIRMTYTPLSTFALLPLSWAALTIIGIAAIRRKLKVAAPRAFRQKQYDAVASSEPDR